MPVDKIDSLWLITTYQCSATCTCCLFDAGPSQKTWMTLEDATKYVELLLARNPLQSVGIAGGEALLRPELVLAIGKMAKQHGVADVMIVGTNCSWATSDERARELLVSVLDTGLRIGFSVDVFHQEFVTVERVERACRLARELGMADAARPNAVLLESMEADNPYDRSTQELAARLEGQGYKVDACPPGRVMYSGRAARLGGHYSGPRSIPDEVCRSVPWVSGALEHPSAIQIGCDGWVMVEHGISIGNAKDTCLTDILDAYDPERTPIVKTLIYEGPIGLTKLPEASGFTLRPEGYVDKCHLCYEIREYLRPFFPEHLAPSACYPDDVATSDAEDRKPNSSMESDK